MEFIWGAEQEKALQKLKTGLSLAPALKPLVYTLEDDSFVGRIVFGIDASGLLFGANRQQEDWECRCHAVRYESRLWTPAKTRYDVVKLEFPVLLYVLKKFCDYLYRVQFWIEIDACTLVYHPNQPISDLLGAIVGRLVVYIRLFSFDIKHVAGVKHKGPEGLLRHPGTEDELRELVKGGEEAAWMLEEFVDRVRDAMWVSVEEEKACMGFCNCVSHCFFCYFLCFAEERESMAMWWACVFLFYKAMYEGKRI